MPHATESTSQLSPFIETAKAQGASDEFLFRLLEDRGWPGKKIYAAFAAYYERATGVAMPARAGGAGEAARDAFLYLLSFSMLGVWTIALGTLLFAYLERWFPDTLAGRGFPDPASALSTNLAMVIVGFPLYLVTMRFILRDLEARPEKHESGVRKWLTYIALFVAAAIVAGDLITFLAFFLRGEITVRFVLKVLTVLLLAGGVFCYYLGFSKPPSEGAAGRGKDRLFALAAGVAVVAILVAGFANLGSPARQRLVSADRQRVEDLQMMTRELHLRRNRAGAGELPDQLGEITFAQPGVRLRLKDPVTLAPYEYHKRAATAYELCALFATASEAETPGARPNFWDHPRGRYCYQIDVTVPPWSQR